MDTNEFNNAISELLSNNDDIAGILILSDSFEVLSCLPEKSISAVITDPPYFLDGMGDTWNDDMTGRKHTSKQRVKSLRAGMKFDKKQGMEFERFMNRIATVAFNALMPGGWFASFSSPRLYHRLGVALEDAGYDIRDMMEWLYTQNQMKAMGLFRQNDKALETNDIDEKQYRVLADELQCWKTPQMKSCFEPIALAQKPREGTFYDNWRKYHIGLVNVKSGVGTSQDMSTCNVMTTDCISDVIDATFLVSKPGKKEKGSTDHLSVKPLALMEHLCDILVPYGGIIVDPFLGSGTTAIAAANIGRGFIGIENNERYFLQAQKRVLDNGYDSTAVNKTGDIVVVSHRD